MATEPLPPHMGDSQNYSSIIEPPTKRPSPPTTHQNININVPAQIIEATEKGMMGENLLNPLSGAASGSSNGVPTASARPAVSGEARSASASAWSTPAAVGSLSPVVGASGGGAGEGVGETGTVPSKVEEALVVGGVGGGGATGGGRKIKWKGLDA
ncbi:hypothetical protein DM02DRAFT_648810 [Periconia macrospinosa]|uniref:Uncharacterized protein n=1 Tax=Periconia macrospinosa TaxID=97972 RepID=A0A2V1E9V7_9PLEO|nr:hypothetical protein DM02DRAFT_648810 [Periconia macrospinosa]